MNIKLDVNIIDIITIAVSVLSVFISAVFSYRYALKSSIHSEKKKVYIKFIEILYELKSSPKKLFDKDFFEKCLLIRAELKIYVCPSLLEKISEFYYKISIHYKEYKREEYDIEKKYNPDNYGDYGEHYPYGENGIELEESEKEESKNRNIIDSKWLIDYLDEVSDLMRKDLKIKKSKGR